MDKFQREEVYSTVELMTKLGIGLSVSFLRRRGIEPAADLKKGMAIYWYKRDFPMICTAISDHLTELKTIYLAQGE